MAADIYLKSLLPLTWPQGQWRQQQWGEGGEEQPSSLARLNTWFLLGKDVVLVQYASSSPPFILQAQHYQYGWVHEGTPALYWPMQRECRFACHHMLLTHEGVPKNFFLEIHHKKFLIYRPLNKNPPALFSFNMRLGHNFWLGSPIGTRSTRLSAILQDFFRDIPFDLIWRAQICAQNPYLAYLAVFACVIERAKYGHVGCPWKDLARCSSDALTIVWMGLPSQKLWPNLIFGRFPHCNYNVKVLAYFCLLVYKFKTCLVYLYTIWHLWSKNSREKKFFLEQPITHMHIFVRVIWILEATRWQQNCLCLCLNERQKRKLSAKKCKHSNLIQFMQQYSLQQNEMFAKYAILKWIEFRI